MRWTLEDGSCSELLGEVETSLVLIGQLLNVCHFGGWGPQGSYNVFWLEASKAAGLWKEWVLGKPWSGQLACPRLPPAADNGGATLPTGSSLAPRPPPPAMAAIFLEYHFSIICAALLFSVTYSNAEVWLLAGNWFQPEKCLWPAGMGARQSPTRYATLLLIA